MAGRQGIGIVVGLALCVMLTNLGGPRLWDRDEPRNAGCAVEMLAAQDWAVPRFNGELRTHKPILLYWLMMASYSVLGVSEFSARLPSALLACGTVACVCVMGTHFWGRRAGNWGGIAVATSLLFVMAGRAATPDSALIFCAALTLTLFALGIPSPATATEASPSITLAGCNLTWWRACGIYGSMGLGALAKGPVGVVLPAAIMGLYQWLATTAPSTSCGSWREWLAQCIGRLRQDRLWQAAWSLRPLTGCCVLALVAVPWYALVGWRTDGEFLRGFFWEHNLGRAMSTMEGHRGNVLFYPATILVGTFPWSVLAVPLLLELWRTWRSERMRREGAVLAACWVIVYVAVFSTAKTKLPSYITPTYPAIGLLVGWMIDRWLDGRSLVDRRWYVAAGGVLAGVGVLVAAGIAWGTRERLPGEAWLGAIGLVPLLGGLAVAWRAWNGQVDRAARWLAFSGVGFAILLFGLGAARADRHQESNRILTAIRRHSANPQLGAYACLEPSWVFYGGTPIHEITDGDVGPTHGPLIEVNGRWVAKPPVSLEQIAAAGPDGLVITTEAQRAEAQKHLPVEYVVLERAPLFLKNEELVLLGRPRVSLPEVDAKSGPGTVANRPRTELPR